MVYLYRYVHILYVRFYLYPATWYQVPGYELDSNSSSLLRNETPPLVVRAIGRSHTQKKAPRRDLDENLDLAAELIFRISIKTPAYW